MTIIGVMSGTSLDGIDIAACKFWIENKEWKYEILKASTIPYSHNEILSLKNAFYCSGSELIQLHHQFGNEIGLKVKQFCDDQQIKPDYIASHGHTIFHQPQKGYTFQLGHGANIAAMSGISTICDFRTSDVANGGQGAPLVPIGDELLFPKYNYCLNLGGISNISFKENGLRKAFDIGICNMALNELAEQFNLKFDFDGMLAQSGSIDSNLLQLLNQKALKHHTQQQSLGYEWYIEHLKPIIEAYDCSIPNKLCTFCEFIALQIAVHINTNSTLMATGGGAKNKYLVERIRANTNCEIFIPSEQIVDYKEALIFAFLGLLRIQEQINCLKNVTGALKDTIGGCVYLA
jgi:anhydro-N-acetylmuramic acid kinase